MDCYYFIILTFISISTFTGFWSTQAILNTYAIIGIISIKGGCKCGEGEKEIEEVDKGGERGRVTSE